MSIGSARNVLAILAVIAVLGGAAWFRSQRAAKESTQEMERTLGAENAGLPRLVDLGGAQCTDCKKLAPVLSALREEYKGRLAVEFIDVWKNPKAGRPYRIRMIPTQILYDRQGREVWRHEGFISEEGLKGILANKVGVE